MRRSDTPVGGRPPGPDLGEARRLARNSSLLALMSIGLAAICWFGWWSAQVNHFTGPRSKGFTEGDPFPWFLIIPLAGLGIWFVITTARDWVRYRRLATSRR